MINYLDTLHKMDVVRKYPSNGRRHAHLTVQNIDTTKYIISNDFQFERKWFFNFCCYRELTRNCFNRSSLILNLKNTNIENIKNNNKFDKINFYNISTFVRLWFLFCVVCTVDSAAAAVGTFLFGMSWKHQNNKTCH